MTKHGGYGPVLSRKERKELRSLCRSLSTSTGIQEVMFARAVMATRRVVQVEQYLDEQVASGVPLDELPIAARWAQYHNASWRSLRDLEAMIAKRPTGGHDVELERIRRVLASSPSVLDAPTTSQEAPGATQGQEEVI